MTLDLLHAVTGGRSLTEEEAESAMRALLAGESTPVLTAAFLTALRMKGETVDELTGFARAMREPPTPLPIDPTVRPGARYLRDRRRWQGHLQHFHRYRDCGRGGGRHCGQARKSFDFEPVR